MAGNQKVTYDEGKRTLDSVIQVAAKFIRDDYQGKFDPQETMKTYTLVYNLVTEKEVQNNQDKLYKVFSESLKNELERHILPRLSGKVDQQLLVEYSKAWDSYRVFLRWMKRVFQYLDRFYVRRLSLRSLEETGFENFRSEIFDKMSNSIKREVLAMIRRDRDGQVIDASLLQKVITIYLQLSKSKKVYETEFEEPLRDETTAYYKKEAKEWIGSDTCPEYLQKAEQRIAMEERRAEKYAREETKDHVLSCVRHELLIVHQKALLEKESTGMESMLADNKTEDLQRLFRLYNPIPDGLEPLARILKAHIAKRGAAIVKKTEETKDMKSHVSTLLDLQTHFQTLVHTCFEKSPKILQALRGAFEIFVNESISGVTTSELLATFCDSILRTSGQKLSEEEMENALGRVASLFEYLQDKDMFNEYYRNLLAKRLLGQRSASDDAERSMISRLKTSCGSQFTQKLEGMMSDMQVSTEVQRDFRNFLTSSELGNGIDMGITILTTGFWPPYKSDDLSLPRELGECISAFSKYYESKSSHRKLRWVHSLGKADINATFSPPKTLEVSTQQATVLMLFNDVQTTTVADLQSTTNMTLEELKKNLAPLFGEAKPAKKILLKDPPGKNIEPTDVVSVNVKFTDKMRRLKIPTVASKLTNEERKQSKDTVDEDRKHAIEAAIVRVMKARKTLDHQSLIGEVTTQLISHFKVEPRGVKKRIEELIAREYLERDQENPNMFKYLA